MNTLRALAACAALMLGACSSDSGGSAPPAQVPPPPAQISFSEFVADLFGATSDTAEPAPVDNVDFSFDDNENPSAFDTLLN